MSHFDEISVHRKIGQRQPCGCQSYAITMWPALEFNEASACLLLIACLPCILVCVISWEGYCYRPERNTIFVAADAVAEQVNPGKCHCVYIAWVSSARSFHHVHWNTKNAIIMSPSSVDTGSIWGYYNPGAPSGDKVDILTFMRFRWYDVAKQATTKRRNKTSF